LPADVPTDTAATLVERGAAAMAAHRWHDAATIYHQLLRRYPKDAAAQAWHGKLAAAQAAIAAGSTPYAAPPPSR
jgi:outer membrane protein assembly factor BamD (BamD/ComL family)